MKSSLGEPRDLSAYVPTEVDDARASRLWERVRSRAPMPQAGSSRWLRFAAVAVVAAAAAAIALFAARKTAFERRAQVVEYDKSGAMTLADGSRIRLRDGGRVRLERFDARGVEVTLAEGSAEFDVVHVASRTFVVHAGRVDVVDVGTRFVVTRDASGASVVVEEGRVEVRDPSGVLPVRTIATGESWSTSAAAPSATETASAPSPEPSATAAASAPVKPPSAKELLEAADAARVAGRSRDAAALLDILRRRHRSDSRAGLAAFELGRLRLDALGDPAGAVEAFDDALALAPSATFADDAEARRVEALERARDPRCRGARDAFLARHPKSVHVVEVTARCAP